MRLHAAVRCHPAQVGLRICASLLLFAAIFPAAAVNPASRPILFVHGFCGSAQDFAPLVPAVYGQLSRTLYPSSALYYVRYNDRTNQTSFYSAASGAQVEESEIPPETRFFSMQFFDPVSESTVSTDVAKISVLNKAYEIDQAIQHITAITHIKDVIVVAHSLGGLAARAYIENMAAAGACYDYQANTPNYALNTCAPHAAESDYGGDVGDLITLDSPHAGSPIDTFDLAPDAAYIGACVSDTSVNRSEMNPQRYGGPGLIEALNYHGSELGGAMPAANTAPIQAIEDYFTDVTDAWDDQNGDLSGYSDDIVQLANQSIVNSVPAARSKEELTDVPIGYASGSPDIINIDAASNGCNVLVPMYGTTVTQPMLHFMSCLGNLPPSQDAIAEQVAAHEQGVLTSMNVTATLNGKAWSGPLSLGLRGPSGSKAIAAVPSALSDLALGAYTLVYASGGPAGKAPRITAAPGSVLKRGQWSLTFTVALAAKAPSAVTEIANAVASNGAELRGTINPEGQPGQAYLEWSRNAKLASPKIACTGGALKNCPAMKNGFTAMPISAKISSAPASTKVYYRAAFYNSAKKTTIYGSILSFTTSK